MQAWLAPLDYGLLDDGLLDAPAPARASLVAPARVFVFVARPSGFLEGPVSQIETVPPRLDVASTETLPLAFDMTALLSTGDSIAAPAATLTDLTLGAALTAPRADASGPNVLVTVSGFEAGHTYRLAVAFTAASLKVLAADVLLVCVF